MRTFQSTTLFQEFSVFENVLVGCHLHAPVNFVSAILGTGRGVERQAESKALEILEFMGLAALLALRDGREGEDDRLARWRSDRPEGYTDARKLLAAVLLVAASTRRRER